MDAGAAAVGAVRELGGAFALRVLHIQLGRGRGSLAGVVRLPLLQLEA